VTYYKFLHSYYKKLIVYPVLVRSIGAGVGAAIGGFMDAKAIKEGKVI
jgi:hypothetical protein